MLLQRIGEVLYCQAPRLASSPPEGEGWVRGASRLCRNDYKYEPLLRNAIILSPGAFSKAPHRSFFDLVISHFF